MAVPWTSILSQLAAVIYEIKKAADQAVLNEAGAKAMGNRLSALAPVLKATADMSQEALAGIAEEDALPLVRGLQSAVNQAKKVIDDCRESKTLGSHKLDALVNVGDYAEALERAAALITSCLDDLFKLIGLRQDAVTKEALAGLRALDFELAGSVKEVKELVQKGIRQTVKVDDRTKRVEKYIELIAEHLNISYIAAEQEFTDLRNELGFQELNKEDFALVKQIRNGRVASVYEATPKQDLLHGHMKVAVKMYRNVIKERTIREVRAEIAAMQATVYSENVCRLLGAYQDGIDVGLVMEFYEGGSLEEKMKTSITRLHWEDICRYAIDMSTGMMAVHRQGYVQRDLKPGNVLLTKDDRAVIADFGIAKQAITGGQLQTATDHHEPAGTLEYLAPEAFDNKYNIKTDVWSFAAIVVALARKEPPFNFRGYPEAYRRLVLLKETPVLPKDTPTSIAAVLEQCFSFDAKDRPDFKTIYVAFAKQLSTLETQAALRREADKLLKEAIDAKKVLQLQRALQQARKCSVPAEVLRPGEELFVNLVAQAKQAIVAAIEEKDAGRLRHALDDADGLDLAEERTKGERTLEKLRVIERANRDLKAAIQSSSESALTSALEASGLDPELQQQGERVLDSLRMEALAVSNVKAAMSKEDHVALGVAIRALRSDSELQGAAKARLEVLQKLQRKRQAGAMETLQIPPVQQKMADPAVHQVVKESRQDVPSSPPPMKDVPSSALRTVVDKSGDECCFWTRCWREDKDEEFCDCNCARLGILKGTLKFVFNAGCVLPVSLPLYLGTCCCCWHNCS